MRLTTLLVSVAGTLSALTASLEAAPIPSPPRHGRYTVQAMIGGRSTVPMCIVAPRTYVDGEPIPEGTQCTIVVYRSLQEGKPGTYTQEVGRGVGPIERDWIDVGANVPCDDPKGGVIYLASSAVINGVESDLNNQYTTIIWSPGNFEVKEYPAAGSEPGPPPSRKNQPPPDDTEQQYPAWMRELVREAAGAGAGGGYEIVTPPLSEFSTELQEIDQQLTIRFTADAAGNVTGQTDLDPFIATTRADALVTDIQVRQNDVTGRLTGGTLAARATFVLAVTAAYAGEAETAVMTAATDLNGSAQGDGSIRGPARTQMQVTVPGDAPRNATHDWPFVAQGGGAGGALLAPDRIEDVLGAPGVGFQTGGSRFAGGIIGAEWQERVVAAVPLDIGGTHFFTMSGTPTHILDRDSGQWLRIVSATRTPGEPTQSFVGPAGVLEGEQVGDGVRVRAIGNGMGEVWARQKWTCQTEDGLTRPGSLTSIWVVPVGAEARQQVEESQGQQPTGGPTVLPGVLPRVVIVGRVAMKGTREPVVGAQIQLVYPEGGAVYLPEWQTRENGTFRIVADAKLPGGGLPANEYEVFVYKGSADASADPLTAAEDCLWPIKRYMVTVTQEAAAAGNIPVGALIQMDYVGNIDLTKRGNSLVRGAPKPPQ